VHVAEVLELCHAAILILLGGTCGSSFVVLLIVAHFS
jgi:hypothetical protein